MHMWWSAGGEVSRVRCGERVVRGVGETLTLSHSRLPGRQAGRCRRVEVGEAHHTTARIRS